MAQKDEVLKILEAQGVYVEAVFLDKIGDDDYLIYFMKEENSKKSTEVSSRSKHPINRLGVRPDPDHDPDQNARPDPDHDPDHFVHDRK